MRTIAGGSIEDEHDNEFEEDGSIVLEEKREVSSPPAATVQLKPL